MAIISNTFGYKIAKWRRNMKIGDQAYFINLLGGKTNVEIKDVDKERALVYHDGFYSNSTQWMNKYELYPK